MNDRSYKWGWHPDRRAPEGASAEAAMVYGQFDRLDRRVVEVRCSWCGALVRDVDPDRNLAWLGDEELAACPAHVGEWQSLVVVTDVEIEVDGEVLTSRAYRWRTATGDDV